jgi:hypothetical protein
MTAFVVQWTKITILFSVAYVCLEARLEVTGGSALASCARWNIICLAGTWSVR